MPRIHPIRVADAPGDVISAFNEHTQKYGARITNMKATLGKSLPSFTVYMQWYVLYEELQKVIGKRMAPLYAYAVSYATECPLCSTFFRKIIIESGENPEQLQLAEQEQRLLNFGSAIAQTQGHITDELYDSVSKDYSEEKIVLLIAFAGQMIATNIFNNVIETQIDDYLIDFLQPTKST
jgi:hypothetical protein